ncbi:hypothetical protein QBC36DRAFT_375881 [Triangularia setosa]|uniref:Uncharacterized protein n=1 Tax=Triangularia setosa TaxID=2587417 RepID=A0AAN6WCZ7_9PEZI|nr:hypothetical protein QBC36DRAFT_375881 [Podospora setosa]
MGNAYVCHCNEVEIKIQRGGGEVKLQRFRCARANQDVAKFRDMHDGKYESQAAFLCMKQNLLESDNPPQMWDIAAYRNPKSRTPHIRTGTNFEGIKHSLCTTEVHPVLVRDGKKPSAFVHWALGGSRKVTVRVYRPLFKSDNLMVVDGGFLVDVNPDSETDSRRSVIVPPGTPAAQADNAASTGPEGVGFQAMRAGYLAMDSESTDDLVVLNQIVSLREDSKK